MRSRGPEDARTSYLDGMAVKATIQIIYQKGLFDSYDNSYEVLKDDPFKEDSENFEVNGSWQN